MMDPETGERIYTHDEFVFGIYVGALIGIVVTVLATYIWTAFGI